MRLYWRYLQIHLHSQMQFRLTFFLLLSAQVLVAFSAFFSAFILMNRFRMVGGYSLAEVMLCFAVVLSAFSLAETFARGFDRFGSVLGNGQFDRMLVRPRGVVFQVLANQADLARLGRLIQAVFVLAVALPASGIVWTAPKILLLLSMIFFGCLFFFALFLIYAGLCFFTTEGLEVINVFTDGSREFASYPVSIYGARALKFYTYVVPVALFQYYPLQILLGRPAPFWYALLPAGSALMLLPAYAVWRIGLRHFRSTGS